MALVVAGEDVLAHAFLSVPGGKSPEGEAAVRQESSGEEAAGGFHLAEGTQGVNAEGGKEADGADSEAGEADEGHEVEGEREANAKCKCNYTDSLLRRTTRYRRLGVECQQVVPI